MESLFLFVIEHTPSWEALLFVTPFSVFFGYYALHIAGNIKAKGVPTPYTRKMVHVAVFLAVAVLHLIGGLEAVIAFGLGAGAVVLYATLIKGRRHILYEGIARETDEPLRTTLVLLPFAMTALGGLLANYNFGEAAIFGYLVAGIGDAAGEPVGKWFGKRRECHWPSAFHLVSKKTYAGSTAVFVGTFVAMRVGMYVTGIELSFQDVLLTCSIVMVVEVMSPRGCDNAFMQIIPAYMVFTAF